MKTKLPLTNYILTIAFLLTLFSCNRIKKKGQEAVAKTQEKIGETRQKVNSEKDQLLDKITPTYDNGKPDTENNKNRFKEHLQTGLTDDVKNIYAYGISWVLTIKY